MPLRQRLSSMRGIIRDLIRRAGLDIVRHDPNPSNPFQVLPLIMEHYLRSGAPFFFVQVGANDGKHADPINDMVVKYRPSGLLVEPLPDMFESLKQNYEGHAELTFARCAIDVADGERTIYRVRAGSEGKAAWQGSASFDRRHLALAGVPDEMVTQEKVRTCTMATLYRENGVSDVTLLQIDAEGFDHVVIESALSSEILPRVINYEHCNLSSLDQIRCRALLRAQGYRWIETWPDTLAVRDDAFGHVRYAD